MFSDKNFTHPHIYWHTSIYGKFIHQNHIVSNLGIHKFLIVVGTLRVPSLMKKGDKILTHRYAMPSVYFRINILRVAVKSSVVRV